MAKAKQPAYQLDGPYQSYTRRHMEIRDRLNKSLLLLLIPCLLYMIQGGEVFLLIGAVYLGTVFWQDRSQRVKLMDEYTVLEQQRLRELEAALATRGIPVEGRRYTFGYRRRADALDPVFLCQGGGTLYLMENVFIKNCVYGVDGQLLYLFDLNTAALARHPQRCQLGELLWDRLPENHQGLLRQEGLRLNEFLVIENFIYAAVLEEMKIGKRKQFLHTTYLLTKMRKEAIYEAKLPGGDSLLLPQGAREILGLTEKGASTKEKAGAI